jgi:hypothetical protein
MTWPRWLFNKSVYLPCHFCYITPLLHPAWLCFILHAEDKDVMIKFLFEDDFARCPGLGDPCSVMDHIRARYGCIPSAYNIWEAILSIMTRKIVRSSNASHILSLNPLT